MDPIAQSDSYKQWALLQDRELKERTNDGYGMMEWAGDVLPPQNAWTYMRAQLADMNPGNRRFVGTEGDVIDSADHTDRQFEAMKAIADRIKANPNYKLSPKASKIRGAWQSMKANGTVYPLDDETYQGY